MKSVELQRCARVAIEFCGHVRPGERVLIVTDTMRDPSVAEALMGAALAAGAEPVLTIMPTRRSTPQEPPPAVSAAMAQSDIAYLYTTYSLTHSSARVEAQKAGARIITMPGVTEDGFLRTLSVDMDRLVRLTNNLSARVSRARTARVTTTLGTDMRYELEHPLAVMDGVAREFGRPRRLSAGPIPECPNYEEGLGRRRRGWVDHSDWPGFDPGHHALRGKPPGDDRGRQ